MQERFSITENWDSASSNIAVMWAISHVITNIHEHEKSMKRWLEDRVRGSTKDSTEFFLKLFLIDLFLITMCKEVLMVKH